jgi:hypothetical protein
MCPFWYGFGGRQLYALLVGGLVLGSYVPFWYWLKVGSYVTFCLGVVGSYEPF